MPQESQTENITAEKIRNVFGKSPVSVPFDHSIGASINKFLEHNGGELVVTLPHYHSWLDSLLLGSETSAMTKLVKAPIMSLP